MRRRALPGAALYKHFMTNRKKFVLGAVLIALAAVAVDYWIYKQEMSGNKVFFSGASIIMVQFALTQFLALALKIYPSKKTEGNIEEEKK